MQGAVAIFAALTEAKHIPDVPITIIAGNPMTEPYGVLWLTLEEAGEPESTSRRKALRGAKPGVAVSRETSCPRHILRYRVISGRRVLLRKAER